MPGHPKVVIEVREFQRLWGKGKKLDIAGREVGGGSRSVAARRTVGRVVKKDEIAGGTVGLRRSLGLGPRSRGLDQGRGSRGGTGY